MLTDKENIMVLNDDIIRLKACRALSESKTEKGIENDEKI